MDQLAFYVIWAVGAVMLLLVTLRIFVQERKNLNTDVTYGGIAALLFSTLFPVLNATVACIFVCVYYKHFQFPAVTWIDKPVYKRPPK